MAEIQSRESHQKGVGVRKSKKLSTRVDLTPMVDLGFLLITFFIFTTTMSKSMAMTLDVPKDSKDSVPIKVSGALTIIPAGNDIVYYYIGKFENKLESCGYMEIRNVIINKKKATPFHDFFVIIKPSKEATYKNIVDIMDEMTINDVARFALTEEANEEEELITSRL